MLSNSGVSLSADSDSGLGLESLRADASFLIAAISLQKCFVNFQKWFLNKGDRDVQI